MKKKKKGARKRSSFGFLVKKERQWVHFIPIAYVRLSRETTKLATK